MKANTNKPKCDSTHCSFCESKIGQFDDVLSVKEYEVSGLCQDCQDQIFADPGDCDMSTKGEEWQPEDEDSGAPS